MKATKITPSWTFTPPPVLPDSRRLYANREQRQARINARKAPVPFPAREPEQETAPELTVWSRRPEMPSEASAARLISNEARAEWRRLDRINAAKLRALEARLGPAQYIPRPGLVVLRVIDVATVVAELFGLSASDLSPPGRTVPVVQAREVYAYVGSARGFSFPDLGRALHLAHSGLIEARGRLRFRLQADECFVLDGQAIPVRDLVARAERRLGGSPTGASPVQSPF